MNDKIDTKIRMLKPFTRFLITIGELPTSYLMSMTYYEQVLWFIKYLQDKVIPAVNNNAKAVEEIQNFLKSLDLQDEVNNKLDEMVESGELQEIISDYLNSKAVFGFDTVEDMKEATNLIDGSYAKTLGFYNINDGGSSLYMIRNITNIDIIDNATIIPLSNENLIAQLIISDNMNVNQFGAKGNGTDDDSNFIQIAINNSISKINFLEQTYNIKNEIIVKSNIEIDGNNATIKMSSQANIFNIDNSSNINIHDFILINGKDENNISKANLFITTNRPTTNYCYNIHIYNIKYLNNENLTSVPLSLIFIGNVYNLEINNCNLKTNYNTSMRGIMVWSTEKIENEYVYTKSEYINIHDNIIDGFYRNIESYGTSGNSESGCRYEMIICNNHILNASDTGIYAYHGEKSIVKNNYISNCLNGCWCDNGLLFEGNYIINGELGVWTEEFVNGNIVNNSFESLTNAAILIGGGTLISNINSNCFKFCENCIVVDEQFTPNTYYAGNLNILDNKFSSTYNNILKLKHNTYSINFSKNYCQVWGLNKETAVDGIIIERNISGKLIVNNNIFENIAYTSAQPSSIGNCDNVINTGEYQITSLFFNNNIILGTLNYLAHIKIGQHLFLLNNIFQEPTSDNLITTNDSYAKKYLISNNINLEGSNTIVDRSGGTTL